MTAAELIIAITKAGGTLRLDEQGCGVATNIPENLVAEIRERREELLGLLRSRKHFPSCPTCGSHCLYRADNQGAYECWTCGALDINEQTARTNTQKWKPILFKDDE